MEHIPELKKALDSFKENKSTKIFTFGVPEIYGKNRSELKLTESDVDNLFNELIAIKEKVEKLYLNGVGITKIPKSINELSNLTFLSLIYNDITNIPDELCSLNNLRELSLDNNKIRNLPECIGNMKKLTHLYLSNNPIEKLPNNINQLRNLEILNLEKTKIEKSDKNTIKQLENLCENTVYNSYGNNNNKNDEFYRNPKIYIDGIGLNRKTLKNVLSKYDFNNIIRDIPYPEPKPEKTKTPSKAGKKRQTPSRRRSRSLSRRRTRSISTRRSRH